MSQEICGRFAPTPSGYLHLGNAMCFLLAWLQARSSHGKMILRMEDLDVARCSHDVWAFRQIEKDLKWLGLDWDNSVDETYQQSKRTHWYVQKLDLLKEKGLIYPCFCSRSHLQVAVAPHGFDRAAVYTGECRNLSEQQVQEKIKNKQPAFRLLVPNETISFHDGVYGEVSQNLVKECGDFILRRADGVFAYQFAVVVDDALMGVNQVVRGRDLLSSTPRQIFLYRLLDCPIPKFYHIPLLLNHGGRRLSKRNQSISIAELAQRFRSDEIVGRLAALCRLIDEYRPVCPQQLLANFDIRKLPKEDICLPETTFLKV